MVIVKGAFKAICFFFIIILFPFYLEAQPFSFNYTPTNSSGSIVGIAEIDGNSATEDDWIAAFDENGLCVGASHFIINQGVSYFNFPIYGDDSTTPFVVEGMIPGGKFTLQIYQSSIDDFVFYPNNSHPTTFDQWANYNGAIIPDYSDYNQLYSFSFSGNPYSVNITNTSGTLLGICQLDGIFLTSNDWVAAFDENGNIAGASQIIVNQGVSYINLPIYGDDTFTSIIDEGINPGEFFTLQLYQLATNSYFDYVSSDSLYHFLSWVNNNGAPMPLYSNPNQVYNFLNVNNVSFLPVDPICLSNIPYQLTQGYPSGGVYSGPNISSLGLFTPTQADTFIVTYTLNSSSLTQSIVVLEPPSINFNINQPLCYGESGDVSLEIIGGMSPYIENWFGQDPNQIYDGQYYVEVTDYFGCFSGDSLEVTEPNEIIVTSIVEDALCFEGYGSALASAIGGTGNFVFNWNQPAASLPAGTHVFSVVDANNCSIEDSVVINEPTSINIQFITTNVSCSGFQDGSIFPVITGGVSPYNYLWNDGDTNLAKNNLEEGEYILTVTDSNGCQTIDSTTVLEPLLYSLSTTVTDVSCHGESDGSASVLSSGCGGISNCTYLWSNGTTSNSISNVSAGLYSVSITHPNGCLQSTDIIINEPSPLSLGAITNDALCFNGFGSVVLSIDGGNPPYIENWFGEDFNSLPAGIYQVSVQDSLACSESITIQINEPTALQLSFLTTNDSCDVPGTVVGLPLGGTPSYVIDFLGEDPLNLNSGVYFATLTDANNCSITESYTIYSIDSTFAVNLTTTDISCFGSLDGTAIENITGGVSPYNVDWGGVDNLSLAPGTYNVVITDSIGCTAIEYFTINSPEELTITVLTTDPVCFGGYGSAIAITNGGTGTASINWGTNNPTQLLAGNYVVSALDANSCFVTENIVIEQPLSLGVSISTINDLCENDNPIYLNQGTPLGGVYTSDIVSNDSLYLNTTGTYSLIYTYTDANNCTESDSTIVTVHANPLVDITPLNSICVNDNPIFLTQGIPAGGVYYGSLVVNDTLYPSAGIHYVNYEFTNQYNCTSVDSSQIEIFEAPNVSLNLPFDNVCEDAPDFSLSGGIPLGGTYVIGQDTTTVFSANTGIEQVNYFFTDTNNCSNQSSDFTIINPIPFVDLGLDQFVCYGETITITPNTNATSYLWSTSDTTQSIEIELLDTTQVFVEVYDLNNCSASDTTLIYSLPKPTVLFSGFSICENEMPFVLNVATPIGGLYSGEAVSNNVFDPALASVGQNSISYTYINSFGCSDSATQDIEVFQVEPPFVLFYPTSNEIISSVATSYQWYSNGNLIAGESSQVFSPDPTTNASYFVEVVDINGCISQSDDFLYNVALNEDLVSSFLIYPNPTVNVINIEFSIFDKADIKFSVFDASGRLFKEEKINNLLPKKHILSFDMSAISNGLYYYQIDFIVSFSQFFQKKGMLLLSEK